MLSFSITSFCNISGGPSKIPTRPAPWASRLVGQPGWSEGTLRWTKRRATWWYSGSSFGPVFWLSGQPSPNWTHWRDRPTHQEGPQGKVRTWSWSSAEPTPTGRRGDWSPPGAPKKGATVKETWDSGGREASWMITSLGLPGRQQQLTKPGDSGEGRRCDSLWMTVSAWLLIERTERNFSFWKLQNQFCLHMQLKTTRLLKVLPREKLEVNPFHVLEIHSQLCLRPQPWQIRTSSEEKKRGQKDILNLKQKTVRSLSVCLSGFMHVSVYVFCVFFFFFLIILLKL